jgi:HlyD family secretion protein
VLAVLDTEQLLKAQLDQATANEAGKRVALEVRIADIAADAKELEAKIGEQKAALERAEFELTRRTTLRDAGIYEDPALQEMRLDLRSAEYSLRDLEIQLERVRLTTADGVQLDQQSAAADFDSAKAARLKAQADYSKAFIRAPIAGRVLALYGRVGQQIDSDGLGEMGDTSQMVIRAEVYETDMAEVYLGQSVTATSRAFKTTLSGKVSRLGVRLSAQSIMSTDPAAIVDARVIEVWIALDEASTAAVRDRTGLQVTVAFAPQRAS